MTKYILILITTMLGISSSIQAQGLIINLENGKTEAFLKSVAHLDNREAPYKVLSKDLEIILVPNSPEMVSVLSESSLVESYGLDAEITRRNMPNDERYTSQWGLRLMDMEQAWDVSTGGLFDDKHDIVIAVLDDGFDVEHVDLVSNLYYNVEEVPDNGIDDDNNGYIDDYLGLNIETGADDHPLDDHGTAVAGIIGAEGDNGIGIAGMMWNVKILPISEVTRQSELIESFQYIVDIRRQWNESSGDDGAFIAATNYSAGINGGDGTDPQYKSWCDMYDLLGSVGILNAGATTNNKTNVDADGDMPTTCPSEFLIAVTNVVQEDVLAEFAGFGAVHIDLGSPGGVESAPMLTLDVNSTYGPFNGTSGATPHVAGTIGLLYSTNCTSLKELTYTDPAAAARMVRDAIFAGVDANSSLEGKTVTGGRLNPSKAIERLQDQCTIESKSEIRDIRVSPEKATITYSLADVTDYYLSVADAAGRLVHDDLLPSSGTEIQVLELSELQLRAGIYYFTIYNDKSASSKTVRITK